MEPLPAAGAAGLDSRSVRAEVAWDRERRLRSQALRRVALPEHSVVPWVGLWVIVAAAQFGALVPLLFDRTGPLGSTEVFSLVGGSFTACGLIAWRRRPDSLSGPLMVAVGLLSFVNPLLSQVHVGVSLTAAHLFADAWVVVFILLLLTFQSGGRLRSHGDRRLVVLSTIPLVVLQLVYMQFHTEDGNLLLVSENEDVADAIDKLQRITIAFVCVAVGAVLGLRWRDASGPARRALLPSIAGAACLLLFAALLVNDLVTGSRSSALLWVAAISLVSVPLAFLFGLLRSRLARAGLANLFRDLPAMRGATLQAALAHAVGDPALLLATDAPGEPASGRSVSRIAREGEAVAWLVYDESLDDDPDLMDAVRAAAGIALENEYLQTQTRERTAELVASRERLVAAGDAERRRLERNLHDGAQQRLVGLALQLRLIERRIESDPASATKLVNSASEELAHSLSELRELARGIHPAVLNHGLDAALESLAARSTVPTSVSVILPARLPEPIELAAYFVASEALANVAKYAAANRAAVRVWRSGPRAVIEISDDGDGGADPEQGSGLRGLADRVEALEGDLRVVSPLGVGTRVIAEFPC